MTSSGIEAQGLYQIRYRFPQWWLWSWWWWSQSVPSKESNWKRLGPIAGGGLAEKTWWWSFNILCSSFWMLRQRSTQPQCACYSRASYPLQDDISPLCVSVLPNCGSQPAYVEELPYFMKLIVLACKLGLPILFVQSFCVPILNRRQSNHHPKCTLVPPSPPCHVSRNGRHVSVV
jgi:hypothetical protein